MWKTPKNFKINMSLFICLFSSKPDPNIFNFSHKFYFILLFNKILNLYSTPPISVKDQTSNSHWLQNILRLLGGYSTKSMGLSGSTLFLALLLKEVYVPLNPSQLNSQEVLHKYYTIQVLFWILSLIFCCICTPKT